MGHLAPWFLSLLLGLWSNSSLVACANRSDERRLPGTAFDPPVAVPDFALTDQRGQSIELSNTRGEVVLLFFGFSHCRTICPGVLSKLVAARDSVAGIPPPRIWFVTLDPASDDPARLAVWLAPFGPGIDGLTGDPGVLAEVRKAFGVYVGGSEQELVHGGSIYAIDPLGRLRVVLGPEAPVSDIMRAVTVLSAPE
jgi:protein SCO1